MKNGGEMMSAYDEQAQTFLVKHGLRFRAVHHADRCPLFCDGKHIHGHRYRVTISRKGGGRVSFDFWNSLHAMQAGQTTIAPYDALACISTDANVPDDFEEFCGDLGYNTDSRKDEQTWKRCGAFAKRLRRFFSEAELTELAEIQ